MILEDEKPFRRFKTFGRVFAIGTIHPTQVRRIYMWLCAFKGGAVDDVITETFGKFKNFPKVITMQLNYLTSAPEPIESSAGCTKQSLPSALEATSTMPSDSKPISLAGWRFATTTTVFPTKSSGL